MTIVLDTNVIIAALVANGLCREVFHRAVRSRALASSEPLVEELRATVRRKFKVSPAVERFLAAFPQAVRLVEPVALTRQICRDPTDDVVLCTAVGAGAAFIVTGDQDLLVLESHEGVRILSPRAFLETLDGPIG